MPDTYRHALLSAFPGFAGLDLKVAGIGWDSVAVEIDGRLIAKFPKHDAAEAALCREVRLLAAARPHIRLPVPDIAMHDGPVPFSLHVKLPGARLDREHYLALTVSQQRRLASELAHFFADLHAIPLETMRRAGAGPVEWWDTRPETLEPVWSELPEDIRARALEAIDAYGRLPGGETDEVYGFFDGHGWNMAFDHRAGRLNGIYDFADSGFGPAEREFVHVSLTHPALAAAAIDIYERVAARSIDRQRVVLLTAAQRLSEFAGALETGENLDLVRGFVIDWFLQTEVG